MKSGISNVFASYDFASAVHRLKDALDKENVNECDVLSANIQANDFKQAIHGAKE